MTADQIALTLSVALLGAIATVWLRPVLQRHLQKRNETQYLLQELRDIKRHLGQNIRVMDRIIGAAYFPAPMHIQKLKIPETSAIFSIDTLKLADFKNSSRLYELRLKFRNLNLEIDDCLKYCDENFSYHEFAAFIKYHRMKTAKVSSILEEEIRTLERGSSDNPQESILMPTILELPKKIRQDQQHALGAPAGQERGKRETEADDATIVPPKIDDMAQNNPAPPDKNGNP